MADDVSKTLQVIGLEVSTQIVPTTLQHNALQVQWPGSISLKLLTRQISPDMLNRVTGMATGTGCGNRMLVSVFLIQIGAVDKRKTMIVYRFGTGQREGKKQLKAVARNSVQCCSQWKHVEIFALNVAEMEYLFEETELTQQLNLVCLHYYPNYS